VKTHSGVRSEYQRLIRGDTRFDDTMRHFLGATYNLKAITDYETGAGSDISAERAAQAIEEAKLLVAKVADILDAA